MLNYPGPNRNNTIKNIIGKEIIATKMVTITIPMFLRVEFSFLSVDSRVNNTNIGIITKTKLKSLELSLFVLKGKKSKPINTTITNQKKN